MSSSFSNLKRSSKDNLSKLTQELAKLQSNQSNSNNDEDRYWKPSVDKAGNGQAIIRFLPATVNEDMPFVRMWDHGFQGPGGWYIEKSLTTLGQQDPVSELNTRLWNSGIDSDKDLVRKQKRRLSYIANIYVVKDPANPENEGRVFLYKFGKKIFDKITDIMNPTFEGDKAVDPFDMWEGANFKLRIRQLDGYRNYDKSEFDSTAPLLKDDDALEGIWNKQYSLKDLIDPKHFKTYDELKTRLNKALGQAATSGGDKPAQPKTTRAVDASPPWDDEAATDTTKLASSAVDDEDEDIGFFKKLARD
jgi:hypothetical protein